MAVVPSDDPAILLAIDNTVRAPYGEMGQHLTIQNGPRGMLGLCVSDTDGDPGIAVIGLSPDDRRALAAILMAGLD